MRDCIQISKHVEAPNLQYVSLHPHDSSCTETDDCRLAHCLFLNRSSVQVFWRSHRAQGLRYLNWAVEQGGFQDSCELTYGVNHQKPLKSVCRFRPYQLSTWLHMLLRNRFHWEPDLGTWYPSKYIGWMNYIVPFLSRILEHHPSIRFRCHKEKPSGPW